MKTTITISTWVILMFSFLPVSAVDPKEDVANRMERISKLQAKEKYDDAETALNDLLEKYPGYGKAWDELLKVHQAQYRSAKMADQFLSGNVTVTTKGKNGEIIANDDSLTKNIMNLLEGIKPSKRAYQKMMLDCRRACMASGSAWGCSIELRAAYVDAVTDTNIKPEAVRYYNQAEEQFGSRNYNKAAEFYKKAIDTDPSMYKARLYLGDVYYMTKRYNDAIEVFKDAVASHPDQLEPRKYLSDAYYNSGVYDKAYATAADAVIVYPDISMMTKMLDAAESDKHPFALERIPRAVLPNQTAKNDTLLTKDEQKCRVAKAGSDWQYYMEAKDKIASHCDKSGIISGAGDITKQHYLEVYSWEYMLSKSKDPELDFARKMQAKGYLDCYVMVSCFHPDFYAQYKNFSEMNKQRIKDYFTLLAKETEGK